MIKDRNLTVPRLAGAMGVDAKDLSRITLGKGAISADIAIRLSKVFPESTASQWMDMQRDYSLAHAQQANAERYSSITPPGPTAPRRATKVKPPKVDLGTPPERNVRHDLDPEQVKEQIEKKVAGYQEDCELGKVEQAKIYAKYESDPAKFTHAPQTVEELEAMYASWIERERTYYATVRVIELPQKGKRFILVYGDADDATVRQGTGPFESLEKAADWFLKSGR